MRKHRRDREVEPSMFDKTAEWYDLFYDWKDYEAEATDVLSRTPPGAAKLLDVACGTGRHLEHFAKRFRCTGLDINPGLLGLARVRCPAVRFVEADMTTFDLGERFDVVTCLFSSVGYAPLTPAVATMARHLAPGGVLLVEPWFQAEQWIDDHPSAVFVDKPDVKAARLVTSARRGNVAILDFHYVIATREGTRHFEEHHELTLYTWDEYRAAFESAGLKTEIDEAGPAGRGLVVGVN